MERNCEKLLWQSFFWGKVKPDKKERMKGNNNVGSYFPQRQKKSTNFEKQQKGTQFREIVLAVVSLGQSGI